MKTSADHHTALRAFSAFLIISLAAVMFFLYDKYHLKVYNDGKLETFTILAILGGVLLIGLLYLINKPHAHTAKKTSKKKKK